MIIRVGRAIAPLVIAAIGLGGALGATLWLHRAAAAAVDRVLYERLRGAGESAGALLDPGAPSEDGLRAVMRSNELDAAYVVGPDLRIRADASGNAGRRADLLRVDPRQLADALAGATGIAPGYVLGTLTVMTGYFPLRREGQPTAGVLVLEAGQGFVAAQSRISRARTVAVLLALLATIGLAVVTARWSRAERARQTAAAQAARADTLSRLAAMAAHEIRNPLGVIRGTVDLMRERSAATLSERDRVALSDITDEVERLRLLTQDLMNLAADKPLERTPTALDELLAAAARATEASYPKVQVQCQPAQLPGVTVDADAQLLRQAFTNLLGNAAQAQEQGAIVVRAAPGDRAITIRVEDQGPGVPADVGERVFDLYFTTKSGGTGLGLAIARRIVERHDGTLTLVRDGRPGVTFAVTLPVRASVGDNTRRGV